MNRILLGGLVALALVGLGAFWWQGRAQIERGAPFTVSFMCILSLMLSSLRRGPMPARWRGAGSCRLRGA